jgi:hypothetical protein
LPKRPTLCVQPYRETCSNPIAAWMRSFASHHLVDTRNLGHFLKMPLPQDAGRLGRGVLTKRPTLCAQPHRETRSNLFAAWMRSFASHHLVDTRNLGHFLKMTPPQDAGRIGRGALTKRPTLCAQPHRETRSNLFAAWMRSCPPYHRGDTRTLGHFIKMTLPSRAFPIVKTRPAP